jgi:hypothetical protein
MDVGSCLSCWHLCSQTRLSQNRYNASLVIVRWFMLTPSSCGQSSSRIKCMIEFTALVDRYVYPT